MARNSGDLQKVLKLAQNPRTDLEGNYKEVGTEAVWSFANLDLSEKLLNKKAPSNF